MSGAIARALVTGATGFIGSALVARLAREGVPTLCLVRAESPRAATLERLAGVEVRRLASFTQRELDAALKDLEIEVIFHLASYGVSPAERDPEAMIEGNVALTTRLVAAAPTSLRRFLFTGSCSEYAPAREPTHLDEQHPIAPISLYGAAKAAARLCGDALARTRGLPFVTLRPFGVYGPGEGPHRLVPHLLDRLKRGEPPELTPGEQARDLTFIDDVVDALLLAATAEAIEPHAVYNLCSGEPVRIRAVAEATARLLGTPSADLGLGRRPYRSDEPMWVVGDGRRFHEATGFRPKVGLDEGLARMIDDARGRSRS
jgi:UDP-glucose 4-epimerase